MSQRLRFHQFVIDLAARELRDGERLLQLSPKIFDCIAYLLENRERAVGRDELMAAVWGRADTADSQLGQAMLKARRALGDSGEAQHTIRTVAGFGYRWIADVQEIEGSAEAPPPRDVAEDVVAAEPADVEVAAAHAAPQVGARPRWIAYGVAAVALLAVLAFGAWHRQRQQTPASSAAAAAVPAAAPDTIVVLPARVDAGAEFAWLRLGVMEFVATRLRAAGQVVAPSENVVSALRAGGDPEQLPAAARAVLKPRYLVVPSARRTDHGWIVGLELQDRDKAAREVSANGDDAIAAARAASERLLDLLGRKQAGAANEAAQLPSQELLSRIDAALLADDLDSARRLLQAAPPEQRRTPQLRLRLAQVEAGAGRFEVADTELQRLLADVPPETDPVLRASIAGSRGAMLIRLGKASEAETVLTGSLQVLDGRGDPALLGKMHMRRGVARALQGKADEAMADFAQSRIAMQLAGDALGLAQIDLNEGALSGVRNHPADALESFQRAERQFERFGISSEWVTALTNQVVAHRTLLQPVQALAVSQRSLSLLGKLPSPDLEHLLKLRRAQAFADNGRWSDADMLLGELARVIDPLREAELAALNASERALLELARGRAAEAFALTEPTVEKLTAPEFASARSEAWFLAIRALHAQGRLDEAGRQVPRYLAWAAASGNTNFTIHAQLAEAEQVAAERRYADADRRYEEALRAANAQNVPADIADVAESWAVSLIARGELIRAAPVVGQLARFAEHDFGSALLQVRLYHALGQNEAWRSALEHARALAMERPIPAELAKPPVTVKIGSTTADAAR
ncbi:winged helix-turn-helix domain-containing protein [Dokdonella sp.]|uniref:winged helix-turn-helix domain-containing protein n=1 Tax=Dokdonella sp. TaxID=2291710 RepID=UPI001B159E14|nr:winged helix-turn-helix domain-containing protein [Dokdonella sp.]MBO9664124.1 winged helix-turn-helix domain-containing protein [Dokdonella sp.]